MLLLAGCQSASPGPEPAPVRRPTAEPGLYRAPLNPIAGSLVRGSADFSAVEGGVRMIVTVLGAFPGPFRVWVHERGNCTSPNGFSAGRPWVPPGLSAGSVAPTEYADGLGYGQVRIFLPGATLAGPGGVEGKSVVVHQGAIDSLEAVPDVPNGRVACGVVQRVAATS